jgi:4-diphosphocytidyl-2-C-methyl-D-erythritol kinase
MTMNLTATTPAKINLFLQVRARRPDGYHEIDTVFLPVPGLDDEICLADGGPPGIRITCTAEGVPDDERNLCHRAAAAYAEAAGVAPCWTIGIVKRIPVAAGLGGGSSDAAMTLRLLDRSVPRPLGEDRLRELARHLGADVPFFVDPRPARGTGVGDRLTPVACGGQLPLVLINPGFPVSTAWAYAHVVPQIGEADVAGLLGALAEGDLAGMAARTYNAFEAVVCRKFPIVDILLEFLRTQGCLTARLCGSGPTVFGIGRSGDAARRAAAAAARHFGPRFWVWAAGAE